MWDQQLAPADTPPCVLPRGIIGISNQLLLIAFPHCLANVIRGIKGMEAQGVPVHEDAGSKPRTKSVNYLIYKLIVVSSAQPSLQQWKKQRKMSSVLLGLTHVLLFAFYKVPVYAERAADMTASQHVDALTWHNEA